jgi:hypothetical protein
MKKYKGLTTMKYTKIDVVGCRKYIGRDSRAFPGTEIFLSTNTGEQKNIILEGIVLGNGTTPTKESDDGQKGSR